MLDVNHVVSHVVGKSGKWLICGLGSSSGGNGDVLIWGILVNLIHRFGDGWFWVVVLANVRIIL